MIIDNSKPNKSETKSLGPLNTLDLLTFNKRGLSVSFIPRLDSSDWVIPTVLILDVIDCDEIIKNYDWQGQKIAVFNLLPNSEQKELSPDTLVILEGETDQQRIGLLFQGKLRQQQIKLSDIQDVEPNTLTTNGGEIDSEYNYQQVTIHSECYTVPDLKQVSAYLNQRDQL